MVAKYPLLHTPSPLNNEQCGYDHAPVTRGRMRAQFPLPHGPPARGRGRERTACMAGRYAELSGQPSSDPQAACEPQDRPSNQIKSNQIKSNPWGGGGRSSPLKEGWGVGTGALVTDQSKEASSKTLMVTNQLRREAALKKFFSKKISPHDTYLKTISTSWGIMLSHKCWGTSEPPPPPTSPISTSGVPVT